MTEQTENATRLARPLIRLAKLVGVATSYVGMSHDYHEIEDDVLVAVLGALGIDASNDEAITSPSHPSSPNAKRASWLPPCCISWARKARWRCTGGMFDVPGSLHHAGKRQAIHGKISREGGEKIAHEIDGSFFFTSYLVLPPICPKAITPSRSLSAARRRLQPLSALLRKSNCSMI